MSDRKKKGLGFLISGIVFAVVGVLLLATTSSPVWLPTVIAAIGAVGNLVGLILVLPSDVA